MEWNLMISATDSNVWKAIQTLKMQHKMTEGGHAQPNTV